MQRRRAGAQAVGGGVGPGKERSRRVNHETGILGA
jgi:hypothetical protein